MRRPLIHIMLATALLVPALPTVAVAARIDKTQTTAPTRALYLQLIRQARADGRPRAAIAYLDDFDRQFPRDREAGLLRVNSLLDLGQVDEAEAALSTISRPGSAGKNGGKEAGEVDAMHGHVLAARGFWDAAIPPYTSAVAADPTSPILRNALGYALLRTHRNGPAIEALRGAADLAPGDTVIRNNLILAYAVAGQKQAAADMISRVEDRRAQGVLRRQIATEAARITALPILSASAGPVPHTPKER
ncbi:MAG: Tetratricopeptide 4 [Sphingomonadales bacterium]|nr:Tetratricopeptide 4 [Sphingomonadales bacterium]